MTYIMVTNITNYYRYLYHTIYYVTYIVLTNEILLFIVIVV